jgi:phage terminase large subunit-like protein
MVEGESGILACSPPWNKPHFEPSKLQLTWPNGAIAQLFSSEEPERLRGPQFDTYWADELAAWSRMQDTWDMLQFGFRLGDDPRGCVTTTPKPLPLIRNLLKMEPTGEVVTTRGSTYDNKANLAPQFFSTVVKKYEGTRLGRQELDAEILEDVQGALWGRSNIDNHRIPNHGPSVPDILMPPSSGSRTEIRDIGLLTHVASTILDLIPEDLTRIVVAVDPNASNNEGSDETGIVVAGKGVSGQGYVLADFSMRGSPNDWASTSVIAHDIFRADRIIGEANQGGNMVEHTITTAAKFIRMDHSRSSDFVGITLVHATRGKVTRAEPVAALYEQGRITHVGTHSTLEDQMCLFTSDFDRKAMGYSPDRVDALVWALTHLFLEQADTGLLEFYQQEVQKRQHTREAKKDENSGKIRMTAPSGITTAYGQTGNQYSVESGEVLVHPDDIRGFRSAGFTEVTH